MLLTIRMTMAVMIMMVLINATSLMKGMIALITKPKKYTYKMSNDDSSYDNTMSLIVTDSSRKYIDIDHSSI